MGLGLGERASVGGGLAVRDTCVHHRMTVACPRLPSSLTCSVTSARCPFLAVYVSVGRDSTTRRYIAFPSLLGGGGARGGPGDAAVKHIRREVYRPVLDRGSYG